MTNSTCGHVNSYCFCRHHFRRTHRRCTRTIIASPSLKSCSLFRRNVIGKLRHSCTKGVRILGGLVASCPSSTCLSSTLCRRKHTFIRVRSDRGTVGHCSLLIRHCPRDRLSHGTTGRVNLLCCRGSHCRRTVTTCGRIVAGCPNDTRTHLTRHSLGSVCISLGGISSCVTFTSAMPNNTAFGIDRHSSLACATTRHTCVHKSVTKTGADLAHCLRSFPRKTFDISTSCCLNLVSCGRGSCTTTSTHLRRILHFSKDGCRKGTLTLYTSVTCGRGRCTGTLGLCGHLTSHSTIRRRHLRTRINTLQDTYTLNSQTRAIAATSTLLGRDGLAPRMHDRTLCFHTGTLLTRKRGGSMLTSLARLTGSAHGICKTRTGCLITRACFSRKRATGTRGRILRCVRIDAPRTC